MCEDLYVYFPTNRRSFSGPGGVGRGLGLRSQPKSVRRSWPLWPPVTSRVPHHHLPPPTTTYHHPPPSSTTYHHPLEKYDIKTSNIILGPKL